MKTILTTILSLVMTVANPGCVRNVKHDMSLIDFRDRPSIESHKPILIAHRGGVITGRTPECSLAAIRLARQQGYAMVELDVQQSRDGVPIVFHDSDLEKACGIKDRIANMDSKQIVKVIKLATKHKIPLVPYITGNNIGGLTIPVNGGIILDFGKKMNKIIHVDEDQMYAILEPGVTFGQFDAYLKENHPNLRYCYPFAPPFSGVVGNAMLSGMNNMSAVHGSMGDWINGLEVVLHNGSIVKIGSCFTKEFQTDNWYSRYPMPDLMGLFVNWQGMTGIVTKCAVQLWPKKKIQTFVLVMSYGIQTTGAIIKEFGRTELVDDLSAV